MSAGQEAHPPASAPTEPTRSDVPVPERLVILPRARDAQKQPIAVLVRKLETSDLVMIRTELPGAPERAVGLTEDQLRKRFDALPPAEKKRQLDRYQHEAEELILLAAIEPRFYRGRKAPDPRPLDDDGRPLGLVPLSALYDADRTALYAAIVELMSGLDGELEKEDAQAQRLAEFPGERSQGDEGSEGADAALPPVESPA